jgi:L-fuculose-phosphate aldolase
LRNGNKIYITPTYSGEYFHWDIPEEKISVLDLNCKLIKGCEEELSREGALHLDIYKTFDDIHSVIHAHPQYLISWFVNHSLLKAETHMMFNRKCGELIECNTAFADCSDEQNNDIVNIFKKRRQMNDPMSLAVAMKGHGIIVAAENIFKAFALLESIEVNAKAVILNQDTYKK